MNTIQNNHVRDDALKPASPTPGGNNTNAVDEADVDKVVPRDVKETQLRESSTPPGAGHGGPDDAGNIPAPL